MLDAQLIAAALKSREAWELLSPHIDVDDITPQAGFWYPLVADWYGSDRNAQSIDKALLVERGKAKIKNPKHEAGLLGFMNDLPDPPSPSNVARVCLELKRHNVGMELAAAIAAHDDKLVKKLTPEFVRLSETDELPQKRAQWEDAVDWDKLDEVAGDQNRIPLSPKLLNERVGGGLLPGDHMIVFGRPEMGKSTFVINLSRGFLKSGQRVLYIGNEDNINKLKRRMRCRLTMMTEKQIKQDPAAANKLAAEREQENGGKLFMRHIHRGRGEDLDRAIEEFEPTVLVLDQIRNMDGSGDKMTQKLESVAIDHRARLAQYHLVGVSVTQANDRTERHGQEPPEWLSMADIDSSRTGLPGQADLILGIGAKQEHIARGQRCHSICKNKNSSEEDSKNGFVAHYDLHRSVVRT